jgi:hypothetical protein
MFLQYSFTSREKRDTFNKSLDTTGKNVKGAVNLGVKDLGLKMQAPGTSLKDADHIQMENGEEIFYSKEKHAFVPVKSCGILQSVLLALLMDPSL